jgi:hypothetical protein
MPGQNEGSRRIALIVATSTYKEETLARLRAPGTDAQDLAEVLADERVGGFDVHTFLDSGHDQVMRGVLELCGSLGPADFLLVYLSCHGVMDDRGRLYYATTDTERRLLAATAISANWLNEQLEDCRARGQILLLDCCHSGAFARGAKGDSALALQERFPGRGKAVLTASRATEYSFEGEDVLGQGVSSVFTRVIVDGLKTGEADVDSDGDVTVTDLYQYVFDKVRQLESRQTPGMWTYGSEGELLIAHSVRKRETRPAPLPADLVHVLESPRARVRGSGLVELAELLDKGPPELALAAQIAMKRMAEEEVPSLVELAEVALQADEGEAKETVERRIRMRDALKAGQQSGVDRLHSGSSTEVLHSNSDNRRRRTSAYLAAQEAEAKEDWPVAIQGYGQVQDDPAFPDAAERRSYCQQREQAKQAARNADAPNDKAGSQDHAGLDQTGSSRSEWPLHDRVGRAGHAQDSLRPERISSSGRRPATRPAFLAAGGILIVLAGTSLLINEFIPHSSGQTIFTHLYYFFLIVAQVFFIFAGLPFDSAAGPWMLWGAIGSSFLIWLLILINIPAKFSWFMFAYETLIVIYALCGLVASCLLALSREAADEMRWLLAILYFPHVIRAGVVMDIWSLQEFIKIFSVAVILAGVISALLGVKEIRRRSVVRS